MIELLSGFLHLNLCIGVPLGAWWLFKRFSSRTKSSTLRDQIAPDFVHDNIALNSTTRKLWLRDVSGKERVVDFVNVREFSHLWTDIQTARGIAPAHNRLEFRMNDVRDPIITVCFSRRSTIFTVQHDHADAREWQARLGALTIK